MKVIITIFSCLLATSLFSQSNINQTLSVNSTGAVADPSAQLDVSATGKGMLVPRMISADRTAIASPATGLLVFDTTTGGFWFYNGTSWVNLSSPKVLADADADTKIQVEKSADEDIIRFDLGGTERFVMKESRLEPKNTGGSVFIGSGAGDNDDLTNNQQVAAGDSALFSNTTGHSNVAIGVRSLYYNTERSNLVAVGDSALHNNGTGAAFPYEGGENTAIGSKALLENTTGYGNTATGNQSLRNNTSGYYNTAQGDVALAFNTTGISNTAQGTLALGYNTEGNGNSALGYGALLANTSGNFNTAMGIFALASNSDRSNHVAVGDSALYNNGVGAVASNQAVFNTAVGSKALYSNTLGSYNTANGFQALSSNTTGRYNTALGNKALYANSGGDYNTALGDLALIANTSGSFNTATGDGALITNSIGNSNTAVGFDAYFSSPNLNNTTCIGYNSGSVVNVPNRVEIGNTSVSWIGGQSFWMTYSDARIKNRVQENVPGLDFITRLRPVTYHLDIHRQNELCYRGKKEGSDWKEKYDIEQKQMTGFIAQEVEAAAKAVGYDFSGVEKGADEVGMYSVGYASFVVPLVNAVQEQQSLLRDLGVIIEKQATENCSLKMQVETLSAQLDIITAALAGAGIAVEK